MGVLDKFHKEPVVITADTEAMFHQVKVSNEDRDLLQFLWWPDGYVGSRIFISWKTSKLTDALKLLNCTIFLMRVRMVMELLVTHYCIITMARHIVDL